VVVGLGLIRFKVRVRLGLVSILQQLPPSAECNIKFCNKKFCHCVGNSGITAIEPCM